jgi:hypothetical protein
VGSRSGLDRFKDRSGLGGAVEELGRRGQQGVGGEVESTEVVARAGSSFLHLFSFSFFF